MVSFFLTYILNPVVNRLHTWGLSRAIASLLILAAGFLVFVTTLVFFVPAASGEIARFISRLPAYITTLQEQLFALADKFHIVIPQDWNQLLALLLEKGKQYIPTAADPLSEIFSSVFTSTVRVFSVIFYILLVPIITYYLMASFDDIKAGITDLIPAYSRPPIMEKLQEIDTVLAGFIRGQLTVCIILAILYSIGFLLIGIELAVVLGTLSGLLFIVPYLGTLIAVVAGSVMALVKFHDLAHIIYVFGWIAGVQLVESYYITPKIVGEAIGLHPIVYILAVIAAGQLFGFVGMLVAVPVAAVLKVLLMTAIDAYKRSYLYADKP
jgi:predicted PurR-regulated permease PerM